jgi:hypothetical protein
LQAARPASLLLLVVVLVLVGFFSLCFFAAASFRCFLLRGGRRFGCKQYTAANAQYTTVPDGGGCVWLGGYKEQTNERRFEE